MGCRRASARRHSAGLRAVLVLFAPRAGLRWKDAVGWLVYPGVYLVYVLARGAVSGLYPYPFVDVNVLGYGGVLVRAAGFLLVFLGMGLLVVAVGRWTGGRSCVCRSRLALSPRH